MLSLLRISFISMFFSMASIGFSSDISPFTGLDKVTSDSGQRLRAVRDGIGQDFTLLTDAFSGCTMEMGPKFNGDASFLYNLIDMSDKNIVLHPRCVARLPCDRLVINCRSFFVAPGAKLICNDLAINSSSHIAFFLGGIQGSGNLYLTCSEDFINLGGSVRGEKNVALKNKNFINDRLSDSDFEEVKKAFNMG